jgi:molecular chaperone IbpA
MGTVPKTFLLIKEKTMNALTRFDTQALNRALIGFDSLFNDVERRFANSVQTNYPPYNVLKHDDDHFEIEIAVAGFDREDVTIEVDQNLLTIKGARLKEEDTSKYLHRGLAARDFERTFTLADYMIVGDAELTNGILRVKLTRVVPEALKPRLIAIK